MKLSFSCLTGLDVKLGLVRNMARNGVRGLAPVCDGYGLDGTAAGVYAGHADQSGLRGSARGLLRPICAMRKKTDRS